MRLPIVLCALVVAACGAVQRPDGGSGLLAHGQAIPALSATDQHGAPVSVGTQLQRPTVVYFYPKDGTPGCTREACAFRDVWQRYAERGVDVIGVSNDDTASHQQFSQTHQLPFPLIADTDGVWAQAFGVPSFAGFYSRVTFLLAPGGKVVKTYNDVDPGLHAAEILQDVDTLLPSHAPPASTSKPSTRSGADALLAPAPRLHQHEAPSVSFRLDLYSVAGSMDPALWLIATLTPPSGAHLYWKYLGETGLPTRVEFEAPAGFTVGPVQYPGPSRFVTETGRVAYGYTDSVAVMAELQRADGAPPLAKHQLFRAYGSWLSCNERCVKEEAHSTLEWTPSYRSPLSDAKFEQQRAQLPRAGAAFGIHAETQAAGLIVLSVPPPWAAIEVFPEQDLGADGLDFELISQSSGRMLLRPQSSPLPPSVLVSARATDQQRYFSVPLGHVP